MLGPDHYVANVVLAPRPGPLAAMSRGGEPARVAALTCKALDCVRFRLSAGAVCWVGVPVKPGFDLPAVSMVDGLWLVRVLDEGCQRGAQ
jgi:hypothetical protein